MFTCGQKQNKDTNRSQPLSQISIFVTLCIMEVSGASSVLEESCAVALHCISFWSPYPLSATVCEADQSEHLCPALCLSTKSKMAAITGTQWRGKIRVPKVFSSSIRAKTYSDLAPLVSFSRLVMDLSSQVFRSMYALPTPRFPLSCLLLSLTVCSLFLWKQ